MKKQQNEQTQKEQPQAYVDIPVFERGDLEFAVSFGNAATLLYDEQPVAMRAIEPESKQTTPMGDAFALDFPAIDHVGTVKVRITYTQENNKGSFPTLFYHRR